MPFLHGKGCHGFSLSSEMRSLRLHSWMSRWCHFPSYIFLFFYFLCLRFTRSSLWIIFFLCLFIFYLISSFFLLSLSRFFSIQCIRSDLRLSVLIWYRLWWYWIPFVLVWYTLWWSDALLFGLNPFVLVWYFMLLFYYSVYWPNTLLLIESYCIAIIPFVLTEYPFDLIEYPFDNSNTSCISLIHCVFE